MVGVASARPLVGAHPGFFSARDVLEVETPTLSSAGTTDPHIHSFATAYSGPGQRHGQRLYLHSSPEFPMKRLLAAGSGCIYQIAKVFRDGEAGRYHQPEFTLLEWYRVGFDQHRLMREVARLVQDLLDQPSLLQDPEYLSYAAIFQRHLRIDPHRATVAQLKTCAAAQDLPCPPGMPEDDIDPWLHWLLSHCIEPHLGRDRLTFIYDYPASQAALARIRPGDPPLADRFELYYRGIELANGFHELSDADEQRRRFTADNQRRVARGLAPIPPDEYLLAALAAGLPDCAGVALGLDRLLMLATDNAALEDVLAFPLERN